MAEVNNFEDLNSWKESRKLTNRIYNLTGETFQNDYGLIEQLRDAAVSIMSNIAEGFGRESDDEFIRFLFIAKSSASEVQSQLYIAKDQGYIEDQEFDEAYDQLDHISRLISNHIKYLKKS